MRNPPQIIALSIALLLGLGSAGHAETLIQKAVGCLHLETLDRLHQLAQAGGRAALDFMKEQFKSGECSNLSQIGASVRADQRVKTEVCIVPAGSSEPCLWVPSQVVKWRGLVLDDTDGHGLRVYIAALTQFNPALVDI